MARAVTVIPPTIQPITHLARNAVVRRRVAAYARVSTSSEEQLTSYEAQVDYYTRFIQSKPEWEFVRVYTDEGISAVNTKKREGFNQMVRDALDGKIDLIVTKSVSRFARNTVDSLVTVRKLKEKGVEVYFEKENIYTLDSKGELLITIMSSLAQEESRSISENVTWGQRKRFADGKVSLPYSHFLGYRKGDNGLPEIVPEEAETVRWIYSLFLSGKTTGSIASLLTREGIPTPAGKKKWAASTVESILKNEKYKGDALLQKAFTVDFLTKKQKKNEGEVPQYYVENSHPAIIDPAEWKLVQRELERRKAIGEIAGCCRRLPRPRWGLAMTNLRASRHRMRIADIASLHGGHGPPCRLTFCFCHYGIGSSAPGAACRSPAMRHRQSADQDTVAGSYSDAERLSDSSTRAWR